MSSQSPPTRYRLLSASGASDLAESPKNCVPFRLKASVQGIRSQITWEYLYASSWMFLSRASPLKTLLPQVSTALVDG